MLYQILLCQDHLRNLHQLATDIDRIIMSVSFLFVDELQLLHIGFYFKAWFSSNRALCFAIEDLNDLLNEKLLVIT